MLTVQLLGHLWRGEPRRQPLSLTEQSALLRPGEVQYVGAGGYRIIRCISLVFNNVDHFAGRHRMDSEFVFMSLQELLGSIAGIEGPARRIGARPGVVAADDQVTGPVVLTDDGVPERLARSPMRIASGSSESMAVPGG